MVASSVYRISSERCDDTGRDCETHRADVDAADCRLPLDDLDTRFAGLRVWPQRFTPGKQCSKINSGAHSANKEKHPGLRKTPAVKFRYLLAAG